MPGKIALLSGFMRVRKDFQTLEKSLKAQGWEVCSTEILGSPLRKASKPFTWQDMLLDIQEQWQKKNWKPHWILGISMGGMLAQGLRKEAPLLLVSTAPRGWKNLLEPSQGPKLLEPFFKEEYPLLKEVEKAMEVYVGAQFLSSHGILVRNLALQWWTSMKDPSFRQQAFWQAQAMADFSLEEWEDDELFPQDVHIFHGKEDKIFPPFLAKKLAEKWGASLTWSQQGGHILLAESYSDLEAWVFQALRGP